MMKKLILLPLILFTFGCASVLETAAPFIPAVEFGAAEKGFGLEIDPATLGVRTFCLKEDGAPARWLDKVGAVPVTGIFTEFIKRDVFGLCPEIPQPEVPVE